MREFKRRDRTEIMIDILTQAGRPISITKLVYRTNLNFMLVRNYAGFLIDKELLEVVGNSHKSYRTTEKGVEFLKGYRRMIELLEGFSINKEVIPKGRLTKEVI